VVGYTAANDVSARDVQLGDGQWVRGKSLDTFCPLGPALVTADEIPDPQNLAISSSLNGVIMQESHTREMIFSVAHIIAFCSQAFTLEPGDIILTGTPHGVGMGRYPQVYMQDGDVIVVEIEGIGRLENSCRVID
jgi:2-keto-4-pentenoate hydratase/2-oxohepta-3-ene-1,7-dioic acid hydratase in catechol pathway